jgi:hypothetical protein
MGSIATIVLVLVVVIKRRREKNKRAQENNVAGKGKPCMPKEGDCSGTDKQTDERERERELIKPT